MHKTPRRFFAFSFPFLVCLTLTASAVVPPVEKLLPEDTIFMVTTPDYLKLRDIYRTSPQTQFWSDPAMKPFKERFLSKMSEELIQPLERDLNVQFEDYTNLLQGQITLAVAQNDWPAKEGQRPGLLVLIDTKDKSTQLSKNIADLRKKWVEGGKTLRTEKIRGVEFAAFPISQKDMPKTLRKFSGPEANSDPDESTTNAPNGPKTELFLGQYESLLIAGTEAGPIERVLAHVTGGAVPSMGDLAAYDHDRLALFRDSPFYGWVNSKALVDGFTHQTAKAESDTPDPFAALSGPKILNAVGLGGVKTVAFATQVANDGTSMQVFADIPESSRQGLLKIFAAEAKDSSPPPFVPADAIKFQRWRIDGQKAWATIQKIASDISPQASGAISLMLGTANEMAKQKDPDFDINKSFFGNLGDDLISYQKAPRGKTLSDLNSAPSLVLIGSPNPDQLASALKYLLAIANPQAATPTEREFLGRKIYSVPAASSMMPMGSFGSGLNYAASGGYVAMSTDASLVEEYLRSSDSQQKTLRETPGLTDAIAKVGGSTGMFGFENQTETTRALFEALRASAGTNSTSPGAVPGFSNFPGADNIKDWMDFSLLPPFDSVSKYFGISVYTASADADGLAFKLFAPVPPALRK